MAVWRITQWHMLAVDDVCTHRPRWLVTTLLGASRAGESGRLCTVQTAHFADLTSRDHRPLHISVITFHNALQ